MKNNMERCAGMDRELENLLLDPETVSAKVKTHVGECDRCKKELQELRATMALMDVWEGPEPSPYFLTRLNARLDEAREAPPIGWLGRFRARVAYGPQMHARPLAAMALTVLLLLGGGAYLGITNWDKPPVTPSQAKVVHDLQMLENNAQLLDQLEAITSNNDNSIDSN